MMNMKIYISDSQTRYCKSQGNEEMSHTYNLRRANLLCAESTLSLGDLEANAVQMKHCSTDSKVCAAY